MAQVWYSTRERVKAAPDYKFTARNDAQVDRAIESASRSIEGGLHRRFYPQTATRYFDWPNFQYARSWRLWLDSNELISITSMTAGGVTIAADDRFLRRSDDLDEPPYTHIEIDLASSAAFASGDTHQRSIAVTGLWGHSNNETEVGALTGNLSDSGTAGIELAPSVGVGSILRIDSERIIVTDKAMVDSGQNLGGSGLAATKSDETVPVADGTAYEVGEIILIGSERMLIVDIAGDNLTVKRAYDGTTLAAHSAGVDVYALAAFTVERGQLGTSAAAHLSGAAIYRWDPPPLIESLCIGAAVSIVEQDSAGWGRVVGSGENEREAAGRGLRTLWDQAYVAFGRKARIGAI